MPERSLRQKSQENIASADLLVNKGYFNASVHCSYYGCLQLMKLVINNVGHIDFDTQHSESNNSIHGGSHKYYLKTFKDIAIKVHLKSDIETYTNDIKKLKELRVRADYDPEMVDSGKCASAVSTAKLFKSFVFDKILKK